MYNVLVTGGAGYIGAYLCLALTKAGHRATILDNSQTASPNMFDRLAQLAAGRSTALHLFGTDFSTTDGSVLRDFIHAADSAQGDSHLVNLRSARGTSVLQMCAAYARAAGCAICCIMLPHRPSDAATSLVCTARTACVVGFVAGRDLVAIHANDLAFAHRDFPKTDIETPDYP